MNINLHKEQSAADNRKQYYSRFKDQLDKLWHDIDADKFGAAAKTGGFYLARKAVKDKYT